MIGIKCIFIVFLPVSLACEGNFEGVSCDRCVSGWAGSQCDVNIDDCTPNPCMHGGVCFDVVNGYECHCVDGYLGNECQVQPVGDICMYENKLIDVTSNVIHKNSLKPRCSSSVTSNCVVDQ